MSPKLQAITTGAVSAFTGFISFIANTPPEQQSDFLATLLEFIPITWRPQVAVYFGALSKLLLFWSLYKAAQSGPSSKPANPANP